MRDVAHDWEALLARLFVDEAFRTRFRRDPKSTGKECGLDESSLAAFAEGDWVGLDLAARSYSRKRAGRRK